MNELTLDDVKQLLLDVYLLQRENTHLRMQVDKLISERTPERDDTEA